MEILPEFSELKILRLLGLMTMAPFDATESECNDILTNEKITKVEISEMNLSRIPCTELSMGMSRDYEIAIKNGATLFESVQNFLKIYKS